MIFHSLLIYFSIYIVTSKCFLNSVIYTPTRYYWLILVQCFMQFQACSIYILSMLIRSIFNSATSSPFQVSSNSAIFSYNTCLSFTHPNFSAIFSLVQCLYNSKFLPTLYSLSVFFPHMFYTFNSSLTT